MDDYWKECITEAFQEAKIAATQEQISIVTSWAEGCHENYGMAHGHDVIPNPRDTEIDRLNIVIAKIKEAHQDQIEGIRFGVARRRNVHHSQVSINDRGQVTIHE